MAFHLSRRKLAPSEDAEPGELNVVPYLDILMNLIIFMLLSMAGLATWGMVNVNAPGRSARATPALLLTVAVSRSGFFVTTQSAREAAIPRRADGAYDFEALTARLQELKARFPLERSVVIAAEADTDYEALVATVDAARETSDRRLLFPEVTLAHF